MMHATLCCEFETPPSSTLPRDQQNPWIMDYVHALNSRSQVITLSSTNITQAFTLLIIMGSHMYTQYYTPLLESQAPHLALPLKSNMPGLSTNRRATDVMMIHVDCLSDNLSTRHP